MLHTTSCDYSLNVFYAYICASICAASFVSSFGIPCSNPDAWRAIFLHILLLFPCFFFSILLHVPSGNQDDQYASHDCTLDAIRATLRDATLRTPRLDILSGRMSVLRCSFVDLVLDVSLRCSICYYP